MNTLWLPPFSGTAAALANHLWQSTVFAGAVWLLTLLLRDNQARIRYALWLAASLKFLLPCALLITLGSLLPQPQRTVAVPSQTLYSAVDLATQPFAQWEPTPVAHPTPTPAERIAAHLPAILFALWIAGALAVLLTWYIRWRTLNATLRCATPAHTGREHGLLRRVEATLGTRSPLPLRLSAELVEPGIFGIFRPVLVWPQRLTSRLLDEHIEAILTHELMHARRRDNLTAALHMLVEAALWFHPLVWWIGSRLLDERERACDEAVVQLGGRPEAYAESLLKACRFCIESPLPCVSGITGADLAERVRSIMTAALTAKLTLSRKLLLVAAAAIAIAAPLAIGQFAVLSDSALMARLMQVHTTPAPPPPPPPPPGWKAQHPAGALPVFEIASNSGPQVVPTAPAAAAQPQARSAVPPLTFAVVSIKENRSSTGFKASYSPDGFHAQNASALMILRGSYGMFNSLDDKFVGVPDWAKTVKFDIDAKVDPADLDRFSKLTQEQRNLMVQALFAERFKLNAHRETKELPLYALVVAKSGSKLKPAVPGDPYTNGLKNPYDGRTGAGVVNGTPHSVAAQAIPVTTLAVMLTQIVGRTVEDRTGLTGLYDLHLEWTPERQTANSSGSTGPDSGAATGGDSGPSIFTAVQEQLGLKLQATKGPTDVLVIDHIERPTEN